MKDAPKQDVGVIVGRFQVPRLRGGLWYDCFKEPLDKSKTSMHGLLGTYKAPDGSLYTAHRGPGQVDAMVTVFDNGFTLNDSSFDEVRARAALR